VTAFSVDFPRTCQPLLIVADEPAQNAIRRIDLERSRLMTDGKDARVTRPSRHWEPAPASLSPDSRNRFSVISISVKDAG
jgi:hypothetical protein